MGWKGGVGGRPELGVGVLGRVGEGWSAGEEVAAAWAQGDTHGWDVGVGAGPYVVWAWVWVWGRVLSLPVPGKTRRSSRRTLLARPDE